MRDVREPNHRCAGNAGSVKGDAVGLVEDVRGGHRDVVTGGDEPVDNRLGHGD
jgi:hypothetical protein